MWSRAETCSLPLSERLKACSSPSRMSQFLSNARLTPTATCSQIFCRGLLGRRDKRALSGMRYMSGEINRVAVHSLTTRLGSGRFWRTIGSLINLRSSVQQSCAAGSPRLMMLLYAGSSASPLTTQSSRTCFASRLISDVRHTNCQSIASVLPACGAPSSSAACAGGVTSSVTLRLYASSLRWQGRCAAPFGIPGRGAVPIPGLGPISGRSCVGQSPGLSSAGYQDWGSRGYPGAPNDSFKPSPHRYCLDLKVGQCGPA